MNLLKNTQVNGFTLHHKLGEGGMAEVWYAENQLGKAAAVKILKTELNFSPDIVSRFENEAKIMLKLNHDNIRQVYDYGAINKRTCIIMEYIEGEDLQNKINNNVIFSNNQIVELWNICVDAFAYMHKNGVIHRDIKPSNLFLTTNNKLKILDFGIAKDKDFDNKTKIGTNLGTLIYMSPEQIKDSKNIDYKTDIYSLAVTFYHLLRGKYPYDITSSSDFEIRSKIVNEKLDLLDIANEWSTLLKQYLHKNPEKRADLQKITINNQESAYIQQIELNKSNNSNLNVNKHKTVVYRDDFQEKSYKKETKVIKSNKSIFTKLNNRRRNIVLIGLTVLLLTSLLIWQVGSNKKSYSFHNSDNKNNLYRDFEANYTGIIDFSYNINVYLKSKDGKLSGTYSYVNNQGYLTLKGEIENDGSFVLQEFNELGNMTGVFKGKINANEISGEWCKPNGSNVMNFYMTKN
jgi:serine/threonine protein kinase